MKKIRARCDKNSSQRAEPSHHYRLVSVDLALLRLPDITDANASWRITRSANGSDGRATGSSWKRGATSCRCNIKLPLRRFRTVSASMRRDAVAQGAGACRTTSPSQGGVDAKIETLSIRLWSNARNQSRVLRSPRAFHSDNSIRIVCNADDAQRRQLLRMQTNEVCKVPSLRNSHRGTSNACAVVIHPIIFDWTKVQVA